MLKRETNPTQVIIVCPILCDTHGFTLGGVYDVVKRPIECPDSNGFDVWVTTVIRPREIKIFSTEYDLLPQEWDTLMQQPLK